MGTAKTWKTAFSRSNGKEGIHFIAIGLMRYPVVPLVSVRRKAPLLITQEMVDSMAPGSVTIDLAAEAGGNIATTVPGEVIVTPNGVTSIGYTDLPSRLPRQSSQLYGNNVFKFLDSMGPKGRLEIDHKVISSTLIIKSQHAAFIRGKADFPDSHHGIQSVPFSSVRCIACGRSKTTGLILPPDTPIFHPIHASAF